MNTLASKYISLKEKILCIGIEEGDNCMKESKIRSSNQGALVCFIISLLTTLATSFFVPAPYIFIPLVLSFVYLIAFLFNYLGFFSLAGISSWGISLLLFFWLSSAYGKDSNEYLLFIIAEMVAVFNLDIRKTTRILFVLSLPVILAIICYWTDFSLFLIPTITDEDRASLNPILYFTVIISSGVSVWMYAKRVQMNVEKLEDSQKALHEKFAELEKMHEELQQTHEELQKTNEELDRFVYSVSHDLRAPITSVMGLLDLCANDKANIDTYLGLQRKSIHKLDAFIQDILHYARNSRLEVAPMPLDFEKIIREIFESQSYAESALDMELTLNVQGNSVIYSDEFRLNIIISNIISNAIRYRKKGINNAFIHFEILLSPDEVRIEVSDNGIGIEAKHLGHIFQMFYRANKKSVGSGLGLYIVKEAITKLKGRVEAQSLEGKGTTFILTIPNLMKGENQQKKLPPTELKEMSMVL